MSGCELTRRKGGETVFGLTAPLIQTSDGRKMGKTEGGAIWLNADKLSPYDYWQFWRNTNDDDVIQFMKLFTELDLDRIGEMEKWAGSELNAAKIILADEATTLLHGGDCLEDIHRTAQSMFENKNAGEAIQATPVRMELIVGAKSHRRRPLFTPCVWPTRV